MPQVNISPGELIDRLTITMLRIEHIQPSILKQTLAEGKPDQLVTKDQDRLHALYGLLGVYHKEFMYLLDTVPRHKDRQVYDLFNETYKLNRTLWDLEDDIREQGKTVASKLNNSQLLVAVNTSLLIAAVNDQRANVREQINLLFSWETVEQKMYKSGE